jgi:8-hydroxy-5-deazaflavin:NADPH oxidoreductase
VRIGMLGTGSVGHALGTRLVEAGHEVTMGSRDPDNPKARQWAAGAGDRAHAGDFAAAAAGAEVLVNATAGAGSLAALAAAGDLAGKVIIDVANALDGSAGMPPTLSVPQGDSLAEQIQRAHPDARVVKTLNTMNGDVMAHPELLAGDHDVFVAGDDPGAKDTAIALLGDLGWPATAVVDLGGLQAARGLEFYVLFWVAVRMATGHNHFNIKVVGR